MRRVRIAGPARRDILNILQSSERDFGAQARSRYRRLIDRAISDLGQNPKRPGTRSIHDVRPGYLSYHLKFSRTASTSSVVHRPRHVIAFFVDVHGDVIVARLFHERQMLTRHLDDD